MFANIFVPKIIPLHREGANAQIVAIKSALRWEGT